MVVLAVTLRVLRSSFRARFHGKVIPYENNTNAGAAFGMSRTLGAFPGEEDAAELLRLPRVGKNKAQELTKKKSTKTGMRVERAKILLPFAAQLEEAGHDAIGDKKSVWGGSGDNR